MIVVGVTVWTLHIVVGGAAGCLDLGVHCSYILPLRLDSITHACIGDS